MSEAFRALETLLAERRLFYDPAWCERWRRRDREKGEETLRHAQELLEIAVPYFWAAEQCAMVESLAESVPGTWAPAPEGVESEAGFFLFARPFDLGSKAPLAALAWRWFIGNVRVKGTAFRPGDETLGAALQLEYFVALRGSGQPFPIGGWVSGGESIDDFLTKVLATGPSELTMERDEFIRLIRIVAASFAFLEQRILIRRAATPSRPERRRLGLPRAASTPLVYVVTLRRTLAIKARERGEHPIEWANRWIVRGHWRQQWFPSQARHRPIWIYPYEKGPEDRPLRTPGARLFAVTR